MIHAKEYCMVWKLRMFLVVDLCLYFYHLASDYTYGYMHESLNLCLGNTPVWRTPAITKKYLKANSNHAR